MYKLLSLIFCMFIFGCSTPIEFQDVICLTNVNIIDAEQGLLEDRTIVIKDDRIIYLGDNRPLSILGNSTTKNLNGKFLIPGLWDTHVHFAYIEELAPKMFDLFLAYGVTSVRDTGGELNFVSRWKYEADKNPTMAPRVKVAGPLMDGTPNVYDGSSPSRPKLSVRLEDANDVMINTDILIEAGVDLIKAYEMLTPQQFTVLNNYARSNNLKVTGHVPLSMDVISASNAGLSSMEHLRNLEMSCAKNSEELLRERRQLLEAGAQDAGGVLRSRIHAAQRIRAIDNQDEEKTKAVLDTLAKNQTWQIPTLALLTGSSERPFITEEWISTFQYLPDKVRNRFEEGVALFKETEITEDNLKYTQWGLDMVGKIHEAGIGIMAGTDCPIFFLTPGRSLHEELVKLVEAGLSPMDALTAATLRPAEYFDLQEELGLIKEGYLADLLILRDNPLEDINNTMSIESIIRAGKWHNQSDLLAKLME